ncbi:glycosyltransferase family 2 protein, partial [Bifidobacterium breve]
EIIVIDDGSTDSSGRKCDAWAERDSRIRVIHQANKGLADARNTGLDTARGDYIGFVDSDDYTLPDMFSTMMRNIWESEADLSIISYERENPDGGIYSNALFGQKLVMTSEDAFKYVNMHGYFYVVAWDKLAKKELFDGLRYPLDAEYAEDSPVTYQLLDRAERIVYDSTPLYRYRMTKGSQSHGITDKFAQSTGNMLELVRKKYPQDEPYAAYGHLESIVGTYNRIVLAGKRKEWAEFERFARIRLRELMPLVESAKLMSKSQSLQWRLLAVSPT